MLHLPFFRDLCWYICKLYLWYINKLNLALPAVFLGSLLIYMQIKSMIHKQIKNCYLPFFWFLWWYICQLNQWYINKLNLALPAVFRDLCWYICKINLWYINKVNLALPAVFSGSLLIYMQIKTMIYKQIKSCFTCRFLVSLLIYMEIKSMIYKQIKSCFICRFSGIFADIYAK